MSENEIPNPDLPNEIIREILSRLPVKSLLRFRSVSKQWKHLISSTHFIKSHLKNALSSSSHHRVLVPTLPPISLNFNATINDPNVSTELHCPFLNPKALIKILGSCNGLVCLMDEKKDMFIYNPSTRRYNKPFESPRAVLHCPNQIEFVYGLGHSSNPNDIKLVGFPRFSRDCEFIRYLVNGVVSDTWMSVVSSRFDFIDTMGTFVNGTLNFLARFSNDESEKRIVASFNISKETFIDFNLPHRVGSSPFYILGTLKGCISAICDDMRYTNIEIWLMKEYGVVNSWSKFLNIRLTNGITNISYMMPLRSLNDDEILLETDLQNFVVYNGKSNTFRKIANVPDWKWFGDAAVYVESLLSPRVECVIY